MFTSGVFTRLNFGLVGFVLESSASEQETKNKQKQQIIALKNILRNKGSYFLEESLFKAISKKPKGHDFNISKSGINISSHRHMSVTGG